ncbi:hypothetical protein CNMCM8694_004136 [Aspergillus lentulus]|nr:hypothetical protein CNMCM8060_004328 [Aspergillus lentulus]KAF4196876.1 hypothetical protein CNMCM8694_004136 [Aspergillus lentulus]
MPLQRLEVLPTEIILSIATHLTSHKDRFHFARCCHRLFDIVYPCTFHPIELPEYCTLDLSWLIRFLYRRKACLSVVNLILGRPICYSKKHVHSKELPTIDDKIIAEVDELVDYYNGWATWRKELRHGDNCDAWVALLLYILPSLRTMEWFWVESRTRYAAKLVDEVILHRDLFEGSGPLGKLEKVLLKGTGRRVDDQRFDRFVPEMKNGASRVTHLELRQSTTRMGFERLITLCTGLRSFKYYYEPGPFIFEQTATCKRGGIPSKHCVWTRIPTLCCKGLRDSTSGLDRCEERLAVANGSLLPSRSAAPSKEVGRPSSAVSGDLVHFWMVARE